MKLNIDLLKKLCETPGVSGFETKIRNLIKNEIKGHADEITIDHIGNLIAKKNGTSTSKSSESNKKIMIAAHMDEIGFIVDHIDEKGFIRFYPIGGFDPKALTSQRVVIHGEKDILGVMGSKSVHVMTEEEKRKPLKIDDYFIDTGMKRDDVVKYIPIGSSVTRQRELSEMGECITCKSLDNRVSVYILIEVLKQLENQPYDIYGVFTVQEEVGLRGAKVAAKNINPDFGIALDTGLANDTPADKGPGRKGLLHAGAGIKRLDRSVITDIRMVDLMEKVAKKNDIPFQPDIKNAGGTDTGALQQDGGCIAGAISTLTRYLHQTTETLSKEDIISSARLLTATLKEIHNHNWEF